MKIEAGQTYRKTIAGQAWELKPYLREDCGDDDWNIEMICDGKSVEWVISIDTRSVAAILDGWTLAPVQNQGRPCEESPSGDVRAERCPDCRGMGGEDIDQTMGGTHFFKCSTCKGTGKITSPPQAAGETDGEKIVGPYRNIEHIYGYHFDGIRTKIDTALAERDREIDRLTKERDEARARLLTAAGDDLCRLSQEEIKAMGEGTVKIPPEEEFLASCRRFHSQYAGEHGVNTGCFTLAQLVAENEKQRADLAALRARRVTPEQITEANAAWGRLEYVTVEYARFVAEYVNGAMTESPPDSPH